MLSSVRPRRICKTWTPVTHMSTSYVWYGHFNNKKLHSYTWNFLAETVGVADFDTHFNY